MTRVNIMPVAVWSTRAVVMTGMMLLSACTIGRTVTRKTTPASSLLDETASVRERETLAAQLTGGTPYLKVHMRNGNVYVLAESTIDPESRVMEGRGVLLGTNREMLDQGRFTISLDSVAIFETNRLGTSGPVAALTLITGVSLIVTAACLANPKACFGSCPTFYVLEDDSLRLRAEGFSSSIAPSLEARDVDALHGIRSTGRTFEVQMRNEALETHVVRYVNLLAAPAPHDGYVAKDIHGAFRQVLRTYEPDICTAPEGDCLPATNSLDGQERFGTADSADLASRETIDLEFNTSPGRSMGLVLGARQTLLTTYLLYQTLAYMGRDAGQWFARLERGDAGLRGAGLGGILGGIRVLVQDSTGTWIEVGDVNEHGPLSADVHVVPLPPTGTNTLRVRLSLTRGNWRLNYLSLVELGDPVEPVRLTPTAVYRGHEKDDAARGLLLDSTRVLTTLPGDTYTLVYDLPHDGAAYDLFLESRGYYLEWIREPWLQEGDPVWLAQMLLTPQIALRRLAPVYKKVEPEIEEAFWRSRYAGH